MNIDLPTTTVADVELILEALAELPLKRSAALFSRIKAAAEQQMNAAAPVADEPKPVDEPRP